MELLLGLAAVVIVIVLLRLLGAWMLMINEVISIQKGTIEELRKINENLSKNNHSQ